MPAGTREHIAIAALSPQHSGLAQLDRVAAALWVEGMQAPAPAPPGGRGGHSSSAARSVRVSLASTSSGLIREAIWPASCGPGACLCLGLGS